MTLYCSWHPRGWLTPTWIVFVLAVCSFTGAVAADSEVDNSTTEVNLCPLFYIPKQLGSDGNFYEGNFAQSESRYAPGTFIVNRLITQPTTDRTRLPTDFDIVTERVEGLMFSAVNEGEMDVLVVESESTGVWRTVLRTANYRCELPLTLADTHSKGETDLLRASLLGDQRGVYWLLNTRDNLQGFHVLNDKAAQPFFSTDSLEFSFLYRPPGGRLTTTYYLADDLIEFDSNKWARFIVIKGPSLFRGVYIPISRSRYQLLRFHQTGHHFEIQRDGRYELTYTSGSLENPEIGQLRFSAYYDNGESGMDHCGITNWFWAVHPESSWAATAAAVAVLPFGSVVLKHDCVPIVSINIPEHPIDSLVECM